MKKNLLILLVLTICIGFAFANDPTANMTPEQKMEYMSQALNIVPVQIFNFGSARTIEDWDVFQGAEKISQRDFAAITKNTDLIEQIKKMDENRVTRKRNGLLFTVGGGAAIFGGAYVLAFYGKGLDPTFLGGLSLMVSGISLMSVGIWKMTYKDTLNVSVDFAIGVAENYNSQLATKIKMSF